MRSFCPRCGAELPVDFRGEWFETSARCSECGVAPAEVPAPLTPSAGEVTYALGDLAPVDRSAITAALVEGDLRYRWGPDLVLAVAVGGEREVDQVLEDLRGSAPDHRADGTDDLGTDDLGTGDLGTGDPGTDDLLGDDDADGGEEATEAMSDLFVAADRLMHAPDDEEIGADLSTAASVADACLPPYGIDQEVWRRVQALASGVVSDLGRDADPQAVVAGARELRDFLRNYV